MQWTNIHCIYENQTLALYSLSSFSNSEILFIFQQLQHQPLSNPNRLSAVSVEIFNLVRSSKSSKER